MLQKDRCGVSDRLTECVIPGLLVTFGKTIGSTQLYCTAKPGCLLTVSTSFQSTLLAKRGRYVLEEFF